MTSAAKDFPRGLAQPDGSLRFGLDALLLAAFVAHHVKIFGGNAICELGSGCGAALLGIALHCPDVRGVGFEREGELVNAARRNASKFALSDRVDFEEMDLVVMDKATPHANAWDVALANPPYGLTRNGRASPSPLRERALRSDGSLTIFCKAAYFLLRHHGYFFCIFEARALARIVCSLTQNRLGLRSILPVRTFAKQAAKRILICARKDAAPDARLDAPLTLHPDCDRDMGKAPRWTEEALTFCPWLAASPRQ